MKVNSTTAFAALCICFLISLPVSSSAPKWQSIPDSQWGAAVDGLRLSLSSADSLNTNSPALDVAFRNIGDHDLTLNLGTVLANNKVQLPDRINLNFTDARGNTRSFKFCDKNHSLYVAGRRDDYVVPLRVGSTYTLRLTLDQFWCPETNEFDVKLLPGRNQIIAQFQGNGASFVNLDMPAIKLINFWMGKVQSNNLVIER